MSTDQLRQALRGVDFPAGQDDLIRVAQARERRHHGRQHLPKYLREVRKPAVEDELDEN